MNVAIDLDSRPSIKCLAKFIDDPIILIKYINQLEDIKAEKPLSRECNSNNQLASYEILRCPCLSDEDFHDINDPTAPFSLAKAVFVALEIVRPHKKKLNDSESSNTLRERLMDRFKGGIELQAVSNLPAGSG